MGASPKMGATGDPLHPGGARLTPELVARLLRGQKGTASPFIARRRALETTERPAEAPEALRTSCAYICLLCVRIRVLVAFAVERKKVR